MDRMDETNQTLLGHLASALKRVDDNWAYLDARNLGQDRGFLFAVNGPAKGTVEITDVALPILPAQVLARLRHVYVSSPVRNPEHRIQLLPKRTLIDFTDDDTGIVLEAQGNRCAIRMLGLVPHGPLMPGLVIRELDLDVMREDIAGVEYLPTVTIGGMRLDSLDDILRIMRWNR